MATVVVGVVRRPRMACSLGLPSDRGCFVRGCAHPDGRVLSEPWGWWGRPEMHKRSVEMAAGVLR